jgi:hypothetical protein
MVDLRFLNVYYAGSDSVRSPCPGQNEVIQVRSKNYVQNNKNIFIELRRVDDENDTDVVRPSGAFNFCMSSQNAALQFVRMSEARSAVSGFNDKMLLIRCVSIGNQFQMKLMKVMNKMKTI